MTSSVNTYLYNGQPLFDTPLIDSGERDIVIPSDAQVNFSSMGLFYTWNDKNSWYETLFMF